jgi:hypothetical protein
MTNQHHPITPPPELVEDWIEIAKPLPQRPPNPGELATLAARWGADQELEACCELTRDNDGYYAALALRADRRPKPLSLKGQALAVLDHTQKGYGLAEVDLDTIRRALEYLPE